MGRRRRRRRHREASISAMPSCEGDITVNEASAMLLYEAPSGIAIFSFDEACLNNSVKDFWADTPQLTLEFFLKYECVPTPIDLVNDAIDDNLTKKLTRLCGSEKTLVVGSAQHKEIIEKKLSITCLYVDVLDCEEVKCSLKNFMRTLLPEGKTKISKRDFDDKELIEFLRRHDFEVKPEMVSDYIAKLAHGLLDVEFCQMEHLKFFLILLRDFIVKSGIDIKNWTIIHFATIPRMICYPGSSYQVFPPDEIFLRDEYRKILANASRYKKSFSKIDALSVYDNIVSLYSKECVLLDELDFLVEEGAKGNIKIKEAPSMLLYEAPTGIAIFSFDGAYLNNSVQDFWADFWTNIPQLCLEEFIKRENVSTPFDPANGAIDNLLAERLTRLCGTTKKLVVGSAQHKAIIEKNLGITCLCVDVPDRELIKCSFPMPTLLPEEKSETSERDFDDKELIEFLSRHDFDVKPEMVSEYIAKLAHRLRDVELCQKEHLKFFHILLRDFIVKSGIDIKNWTIVQFATILKMICYPGSSYQVFPPDKIFSRDGYRKILANASQYKKSFSKIDALSVYDDIISLYSKESVLLDELDFLVEEGAKGKIKEARSILLYDAHYGIAIFSFDGGAYLNNSVKDFWADFWANIPQLSLEEFITRKKVPTPFDHANGTIDNHLAESLTRHCGAEKKLVVGSARHKTIIENKLGITCLALYDPRCELIKFRKWDSDELITFLHQHDLDVKPEMGLSRDEYRKLEANASRYETSFSEIDAWLHRRLAMKIRLTKRSLLVGLDACVTAAKDLHQEETEYMDDFFGLPGCLQLDDTEGVIHATGLIPPEPGQLHHTGTSWVDITDENANPASDLHQEETEYMDDFLGPAVRRSPSWLPGCLQLDDTEGVIHATGLIPPEPGQLHHTGTSVADTTDENANPASDLQKQTENMDGTVGVIHATGLITRKPGQLGDTEGVIHATGLIPPEPGQLHHTSVVDTYENVNTASGEIIKSRKLADLLKEEWAREANKVRPNGKSSKGAQSPNDKAPFLYLSTRSIAMKQLCMAFVCGQPVH